MAESQHHRYDRFDPASHPENLYDAFVEFVDSFRYQYDAIAKDPPSDLNPAQKSAWIEQNMRKQFLGKFASRNFQKDYEDTFDETKRSNLAFSELVKEMKERYQPTQNKTLANFDFHKLVQNQGESFDLFVNRVKHEAKFCEFSCSSNTCSVSDILIRDQITIGTNNDNIRQHALKEMWDLPTLVKKGRSLEAAERGSERIKSNEAGDTRRVKTPGKYSRKKSSKDKMRKSYAPPTDSLPQCKTCSSSRCKGKKACPGYNGQCFDCNEKGHFRGSAACKKPSKYYRNARRVESDSESSSSPLSSSDESEFSPSSSESDTPEESSSSRSSTKHSKSKNRISRVRRVQSRRIPEKRKVRRVEHKPRYQVDIVVNEKPFTAFADTGADICVMSHANSKSLGLKLSKTNLKIRPFGSKSIRCVGHYTGPVMFGNNVANLRFFVIKKDVETLLSGRASEELGIISFNGSTDSDTDPTEAVRRISESCDQDTSRIVTQFPKVFDGVGLLKNHQVQFHINPDVPPVAQPPRPIPFHLRERFDREIVRMEEQGIIEEHHGPAPWVSNAVLAPKDNGGVRVTIDMREANPAIKDTHIPVPRVDDIQSRLAGNKVFSKLDLRSAFHQLEIDEPSRHITVFHAGDRLMRYKRMTMGTKPASGELNKALRPLFQHMPQVHCIHDDIIIATKSKKEHDRILENVMRILNSSGLTLNEEKCLFAKNEIPFWGLIVSADGIRPDPAKVEALKQATIPSNKAEVQSFLCMLQSNADFIPKLALHTTHLRKLTLKHSRFRWTIECQKEFDKLKQMFVEDTLLRHFDPSLNTYIFVDAHRTGLSAILTQGKDVDHTKPVAFASRATKDVERRYPQLDREALAIDFALRRYRNYLVGAPQPQIIITDHKPLVSIFANSRHGSVRSDRIKLRHQDINYKVVWKKGILNPADYLSRHAIPYDKLPRQWREETKDFEKTIWFLQYSPYTDAISMDKISSRTKKDPTLQDLKTAIRKGKLPANTKDLDPYRKIFSELTISDSGFILKGTKIVLPKSLWNLSIEKAHQGGHPGMSSLKRRIRTHFWFPKLDELIEEKVRHCPSCQIFTQKHTKEPLQPLQVPEKAWANLNVDLFGPMPDKRHVLVVQDSLTRFPAAKIVNSTAEKPVIGALKDIYTNYGNPDKHRTDNGPPFNSASFEKFSNSRGIEHVKVYPYHPQGNPSETFMKPLGKGMKAAFHDNADKQHALDNLLTAYRSTPHPATGIPPGSFLLRDGHRSDFPVYIVSEEQIEEARLKDKHQKTERSKLLNQSVKRQPDDIKPGDLVLAKKYQRTKFEPLYDSVPLLVISVDNLGVTLQRISDEKMFVRHKDDIKKWNALPQLIEESDDDEVRTENPAEMDRHVSFAEENDNHDPPQTQARTRPPREAGPPKKFAEYSMDSP